MRKLLLFVFMISAVVQGQTKPTDLNSLTETESKTFADQIAGNSATKWELISAKENSKGTYYTVKYINAAMSKETKEGVRNGDSCDDCLKVTFTVLNADTKTFKFYEVAGKYSDLFPTWKSVFRPDADINKTVEDFGSQELISKPDRINFKFKKGDTFWQIVNWS